MKFYSNRGKFFDHAKSKRNGLRLLLWCLLWTAALTMGGVIWFLISNYNAEEKLQTLALQIETSSTQTEEISEITLPEEDTAETIGTESTESTQESAPVILEKYAPLYAQNEEMAGWICIEDTKLNYPVMHTPDDPEKYLHTNFEGEYSYPGVPFIDAACNADSDNLLIYGHNMPNGSMFRSLMKYQEKTFWEAHPVIVFNTLYEEQEFEVLAAFYDRVYYKTENCFKFYQFIDAENEEDYDFAIAQFKDKALYDTGIDARYGDQLITLVTCAYHTDNGRFVVVAKEK